jgi:transposase
MSQTNPDTLHVGVDVAKQSLDVSLGGTARQLHNDAAGHRRLIALLKKAGGPIHVILEASGGYEAALVRALHDAGIALSVVKPARVRAFARAAGLEAKTDDIDAQLLVTFGRALRPAPTMPPTAAQAQLEALCQRRTQLLETRTAETNRAAHYTDPLLRRQSRRLLALLNEQILQCERALAAQIAAEAALQQRASRLQQVPGVGSITAATLLAHLPELGTLSDGAVAALAGLAPYNADSGPRCGQRHIRGGRSQVRTALYMATLSAVRHDPILRRFYTRLRTAGKRPLVALTAAMRKLVVLLNRLLKHPNFQLATSIPT